MMKKIALLFIAFFCILSAFSQSQPAENPVEKIMEESGGNITIDIPAQILESVMQNGGSKRSGSELKSGINKIAGYRIQVFSDGRNQSTLESRAKARGNMILSKFPKYKGQIYTYSSSPNWYTRVGNFTTIQEANSALAELKQAFPSFASEMRTVQCRIIVVK